MLVYGQGAYKVLFWYTLCSEFYSLINHHDSCLLNDQSRYVCVCVGVCVYMCVCTQLAFCMLSLSSNDSANLRQKISEIKSYASHAETKFFYLPHLVL